MALSLRQLKLTKHIRHNHLRRKFCSMGQKTEQQNDGYIYGNTFSLEWNRMIDEHKDYFQKLLENPEHSHTSDMDSNEPFNNINHISMETKLPTKEDIIDSIAWIDKILKSEHNQITRLSFVDQPKFDQDCVEQISKMDVTNLKILDFEKLSLVPWNSGGVDGYKTIQCIFDMIYDKCDDLARLSLNDCGLQGDELYHVLCAFYERDDYEALKNGSLRRIDIFCNPFYHFSWTFRGSELYKLDKRLRKILKNAKRKYGNELNVDHVTLNSDFYDLSKKIGLEWRLKCVRYRDRNRY